MAREQWFIKNITANKTISIGDMHQVPSVVPGGRYDLLTFANSETIKQSADLKTAIRKQYLTLIRYTDGVYVDTIDHTNVNTFKI